MTEEFLYHYTTLDKLALILKNRTIRLNPLDKMDDLQENKTSDVENLGKIFFTSSWTKENTENPTLWEEYASNKTGVRIGLPKNPFKHYPTQIVIKATGETFEDYVLIPPEKYRQHKLHTLQSDLKDLLVKVEYTNDKNLLEPQILGNDGKTFSIPYSFARCKNKEKWGYQNEWRYLVWFIKPDAWNEGNNFVREMCSGNVKLPIKHFDLEIDDDCFRKMTITIGSKMIEEDRTRLKKMICNYNENATLKESEI